MNMRTDRQVAPKFCASQLAWVRQRFSHPIWVEINELLRLLALTATVGTIMTVIGAITGTGY